MHFITFQRIFYKLVDQRWMCKKGYKLKCKSHWHWHSGMAAIGWWMPKRRTTKPMSDPEGASKSSKLCQATSSYSGSSIWGGGWLDARIWMIDSGYEYISTTADFFTNSWSHSYKWWTCLRNTNFNCEAKYWTRWRNINLHCWTKY